MKIKDTILLIIGSIGAFFSALFYVLFQQKKDENKLLKAEEEQIKKDLDQTQTEKDNINNAHNKYVESKKDTSELKHDFNNGDITASFELLQKHAENGRKRSKSN